MKRRVVVTGIGAVTSLGCKVDELWTRVCNGESGVGPLERLNVSNYRVRIGGEIRNWSVDGYIDAKDVKRFDRFVQFAQVAGVNAVAVVTRSTKGNPVRRNSATNSRPYCSRPAVLGGLCR